MARATLRPTAVLSWLLVPLAAQDGAPKPGFAAIDAIASMTTTPEQRGEAFAVACKAPFPAIACKLVQTLEACRLRRGPDWAESGMGPRTEKPWLEQDLRPEDRISFTLHQLWWQHTASGVARRDAALFVEILEDPQGGETRCIAVAPLAVELGDVVREDAKLARDLLARLDKVARTDVSNAIRAGVVGVLAVHAEPDPLLELALEVARTEKPPWRQGELLCRTGILAALPRMSSAARKRCLREAFVFLQRMDDGKGAGCFLAMEIGSGIGIEPVAVGAAAFTPDPRSPAYQQTSGPSPSYFQDTVKNALAWYEKHKDD